MRAMVARIPVLRSAACMSAPDPAAPRLRRLEPLARALAPGDVVVEAGYEVHVLAVADGRATRVRVVFDRPLEELDLLAWEWDPRRETWRLGPAVVEDPR